MSAVSVMEAMLRNDVAACEKKVAEATPRPVVSKGKLIHKGGDLKLEVAQRELEHAQRRLEVWLADKGM